MSLKDRMLIAVITLIVSGFLISSLSSFYVSRQNSIEALVRTELPLTSDNIYSEVQRDLVGPQIVSSVMANDTFVRDWIRNGEVDESKIASYLSEIVKKYDAFTAFLVVDQSANFYVPSGFVRKVSEQEPRDDWYYRTKQNSELIELNVDPAEFVGDQLTIFFNVRMLGANDEFIAAIGLGLNRDLLNSKLENYRKKYGQEVHFLTPDGRLFLHKQAEYENKNVRDIEGLKEIADELLSIDNGQIRYKDEGHNILVHARYIKEIDLILLVEADIDLATQKLYQALLWNIFICLVITVIVIALLLKTLGSYQSRLEHIAWWDQLTGLSNRQAFNDYYERQVKTYLKPHLSKSQPISLLLMDIDYFKQINDKHGHMVGDKVLKEFSNILKQASPSNSFIARWGGEEFVELLVNTSLDEAYQFAEKIRQMIGTSTELKALTEEYITVSIGVTNCDPALSMDANIQKADKLMYEAKAQGRNRVLSQSED